MTNEIRAFPLAAMSRDIRILTMICLAIPVGMAIGVLLGARALLIPAILCVSIYGWVWLLFRPTRFVIHPDAIEIVWPLKRRKIARESIVAVRMLNAKRIPAAGGMTICRYTRRFMATVGRPEGGSTHGTESCRI